MESEPKSVYNESLTENSPAVIRRLRLMERWRKRRERARATQDEVGLNTLMGLASIALRVSALREPNRMRRESKNRQLRSRWYRFSRDVLHRPFSPLP